MSEAPLKTLNPSDEDFHGGLIALSRNLLHEIMFSAGGCNMMAWTGLARFTQSCREGHLGSHNGLRIQKIPTS